MYVKWVLCVTERNSSDLRTFVPIYIFTCSPANAYTLLAYFHAIDKEK